MASLAVSVTEHDHAQGPAEGPLTLVAYVDFQCPHCALLHPRLMEIARELRDSLKLVFRHYPLADVHPQAQRAAEAAEAAASQGRFWEMASQLFANQDHLDDESLVRRGEKAEPRAPRLPEGGGVRAAAPPGARPPPG